MYTEDSMKKIVLSLVSLLACALLPAQEALKSIEEEYWDFLSIRGIVERPTLGYRTLSDSEWKFIEGEVPVLDEEGNPVLDEDGTPLTEKRAPEHPWQDNNLGKKYTLWQSENNGTNWFTRGFHHGIRFKAYGPDWFNSINTFQASGQNDGALWQGKGYNTSLTGGVRLEAFGFEMTVKPQVCFSQNLAFDTLGDVYGNNYGTVFGHNIDIVGRYGDSPFWTFDWGDTEIRYTWRNFTFGFGTQTPWLGPAWLNPMLGSNNAASYPKVDVGLRKTKIILPFCDWYIADIEGRVWVGKLTASDFYTKSPNSSDRLIEMLSVSIAPRFIPGFSFGLNRLFMFKWDLDNLRYMKRLFTLSKDNSTGTGNDEDQKVAVFIDWKFPKIGFEVYGEFGRDDFSSNEDTNPFHTAIYSVGVKQYIPIKLTKLFPKWKKAIDLSSELIFEWNDFEMSQDFQLQWEYLGYYAHGSITQGYTNKGQLLGAGYGSFGNSQFIGWRIYYPKGSTLLFFHRYCPNNNSVYSKAVKTAALDPTDTFHATWYAAFDTHFLMGFKTNYFILPNLNVSFGFYSEDIKRHLYTLVSKQNLNISFGLKYTF